MFDLTDLGKLLIIVGFAIAALGLLLVAAQRLPFVGRLPGDIAIRGEGFACFIPIATSIVLSIVLTVTLNVVLRLLHR